MLKVVVTGANGYIGSHLVADLINYKKTFSVVAADLKNNNISKEVTFVPFDFTTDSLKETIYEELGAPDICVHLAWRDGFQHNSVNHIIDFSNHFLFLKNLVDHGTKQLAVAGSFREYGSVNGMVNQEAVITPDNFYMLTKLALKNALEIYLKGKEICLQWLRPFTVYGDDERNNSILSKIIQWEKEGKESFPFTDGNEEYDYISINKLSKQIISIISQTEISGVIDCCSGIPTRLGDKIEEFLKENNFKIRPEYGAFSSRNYDSSIIFGDVRKINEILLKGNMLGANEDG